MEGLHIFTLANARNI